MDLAWGIFRAAEKEYIPSIRPKGRRILYCDVSCERL